MFRWNPQGDYPQADKSAYIDPTAVIVGRVNIGKNVFVGPTAVIRADEQSSSIAIGDNCNVQDRVIVHALEDTTVEIGEETSLAHGCIVHGPCKLGRDCFIGFGSVVFDAELGENVIIKHLTVVEKVNIPPGKTINSSQVINDIRDLEGLKAADNELKVFAKNVIMANLELVKGYKYGKSRISDKMV